MNEKIGKFYKFEDGNNPNFKNGKKIEFQLEKILKLRNSKIQNLQKFTMKIGNFLNSEIE